MRKPVLVLARSYLNWCWVWKNGCLVIWNYVLTKSIYVDYLYLCFVFLSSKICFWDQSYLIHISFQIVLPDKLQCAFFEELSFCLCFVSFWDNSAIQNAPNPGGGELQKAGKLSPLRAQPKKLPCRGQATCRGSCDSAEPSQNSGTFAAQIENTPVLCPFHLQPVPEYEMVSVTTYCCQVPFQWGKSHSLPYPVLFVLPSHVYLTLYSY